MRSWSVIKQIAVSLNHNITLGTIPNQNLWISDNTQPTLLFFQYTAFSFILAFDQTNQFDRNKKNVMRLQGNIWDVSQKDVGAKLIREWSILASFSQTDSVARTTSEITTSQHVRVEHSSETLTCNICKFASYKLFMKNCTTYYYFIVDGWITFSHG